MGTSVYCGKSCLFEYTGSDEDEATTTLEKASSKPFRFPGDTCRVSCSLMKELALDFPGQPILLELEDGAYVCRAFLSHICDDYLHKDKDKDKNETCKCTSVVTDISKLVKVKKEGNNVKTARVISNVRSASSVVLRLVPTGLNLGSGNNCFYPPFDTSAREHISHSLRIGAYVTAGCRIANPSGISYDAIVESTVPRSSGIVLRCGKHTNITFSEGEKNDGDVDSARLKTKKKEELHVAVADLSNPFETLRAIILQPVVYQTDFINIGMGASLASGILLRGPPGVGKTRAVRIIAEECKSYSVLKLISIDNSLSRNGEYGEIEEHLRFAFDEAKKHVMNSGADGRCIIFIDEIDTICPNRKDSSFSQTKVVAQLLTLMDGLPAVKEKATAYLKDKILVIGATNKPDSIDPALRRPGRLEREIIFNPPTVKERASILRSLLFEGDTSVDVTEEDLDEISQQAVGFVGSDLASLVLEAKLSAATAQDTGHSLDHVVISRSHLDSALTRVGVASSQRTRAIRRQTNGNTRKRMTWDDIGGYEEVKIKLKQAIEWPIRHKVSMDRLNISPTRGILLYGPPGCAKTTFARVAAESIGCSFVTLSGADIYSPFVGDAEKAVRTAFADARLALPAVLFLDELDAIVGKRELEGSSASSGASASSTQTRVLATLLNEMDGIDSGQGLLVLAASNRIDQIDKALLRPGRFDQRIHVPLPDAVSRFAVLKVHTKNMPLDDELLHVGKEDSDPMRDIAQKIEGFSGAEIENLCREVGLLAMRENKRKVSSEMFMRQIMKAGTL